MDLRVDGPVVHGVVGGAPVQSSYGVGEPQVLKRALSPSSTVERSLHSGRVLTGSPRPEEWGRLGGNVLPFPFPSTPPVSTPELPAPPVTRVLSESVKGTNKSSGTTGTSVGRAGEQDTLRSDPCPLRL